MGKRAAIFSGILLLAVGTVGLLWWREFAVRYQAYRLRRSPDLLIQVIGSPEGTIAGQAVRRIFASGDYAGTRLLQYYLDVLARESYFGQLWVDGRFRHLGYDFDEVRIS